MSNMTDYLETTLLNHIFKNTAYSVPANIYVGLHTGDPGEDAPPDNEVSTAGLWTNYARVDAGVGGGISSGWTLGSAGTGQVSNAKVVTFAAQNGAGTVTVTHVGLYDALTSGNMLFGASLAASKALAQGDVISFAIGSLVVTLA